MARFQKRPIIVDAEQFLPDTAPLPFRDQGAVCCFDGAWYVESANGRVPLRPTDWVILENRPDLPPTAAYPVTAAIFTATYVVVEP